MSDEQNTSEDTCTVCYTNIGNTLEDDSGDDSDDDSRVVQVFLRHPIESSLANDAISDFIRIDYAHGWTIMVGTS